MAGLLRRNKAGGVVIEEPGLVDGIEQRANLLLVKLVRLIGANILAAIAHN